MSARRYSGIQKRADLTGSLNLSHGGLVFMNETNENIPQNNAENITLQNNIPQDNGGNTAEKSINQPCIQGAYPQSPANWINSPQMMGGYVASYYTAKKESPLYKRGECVLALIVALMSVFFVRLVLFVNIGLFATIFCMIMLTTEIIYLKSRGLHVKGFNKLFAVALYIFGTVFAITDNLTVKWLDMLFMIGADAYFVYSVGAQKNDIEKYLPYAMIKALFAYPFEKFDAQARISSDRFSKSNGGKNFKGILGGLLLAVPLTVVVGSLLMSADEGVEHIMYIIGEFFASEGVWSWTGYLLLALPVSCYIFGMLYRNAVRNNIRELNSEECIESMKSFRLISNIVLYTAVTPIILLYIVFFFSQASYFLSAFSGTLPEAFSYAEYARKGFFELCTIAVINLAVIIFMNVTAKKSGEERTAALKIYTSVLSVSTLILIATAMSKMIMYIDTYGLTELRVYTTWFMVLTAYIFVLILVKQFKRGLGIAKLVSIGFTIMFAILCFSRSEVIITKYNIRMYNAGYLNELDMNSIENMSDDALLAAVDEGVLDVQKAQEISSVCHGEETINQLNLSSLILKNK